MKKLFIITFLFSLLVGSVFAEEITLSYASGDNYSVEITYDTDDTPAKLKDTPIYFQAGLYASVIQDVLGSYTLVKSWDLQSSAIRVPEYLSPETFAEKYGSCFVDIISGYNHYYYVFLYDGTTKLIVHGMDKTM